MRRARRPAGPLPRRSERLYVRILSRDIAFFKFMLEARDNLAYLTVLDRGSALAELVFSPGQAREVREFLADLSGELAFTVLPAPGGPGRPAQEKP